MKTDRLIGILSILLQEEKTTAPELAEKFEVSRRTINRDIEDLCKAGIPIRTAQGTGGGISIMDGYRMDRTILTSKDMQMILAGLRSLDSVSGNRYYGQLMEKIQTGSSEFISERDSMLIDLSSWYKGSLVPKIENMNKPKIIQIIDVVSNAIAGNRIDEDFIKSCIYGKVDAELYVHDRVRRLLERQERVELLLAGHGSLHLPGFLRRALHDGTQIHGLRAVGTFGSQRNGHRRTAGRNWRQGLCGNRQFLGMVCSGKQ